jgi:SOS-response transcriptional repressor LexA
MSKILVVSDRSILEVIRDTWTREGYGPTLREIGDAVGMTFSGVQHRIEVLTNDGLLVQSKHVGQVKYMPRSLRLTLAGVARVEGAVPLIPIRVDAQTGVIQIVREDAS